MTQHMEQQSPWDAYLARLSVGGQAALNALRESDVWEVYAYYSGQTLVCMVRPRGGWLNRADGRLTPREFEALSGFAWRCGAEVATAARLYCELLLRGEGALARALVSGDEMMLDTWRRLREWLAAEAALEPPAAVPGGAGYIIPLEKGEKPR